MHIIYCHTNRINGLRYIGRTERSMLKRWQSHVKSSKRGKTLFSTAIREFKQDAFDHDVICECDTKEQAKILERHFIEQLNSWGPLGYNMNKGGGGSSDAVILRAAGRNGQKRQAELHPGILFSSQATKKRSNASKSSASAFQNVDKTRMSEIAKKARSCVNPQNLSTGLSKALKGKPHSKSHNIATGVGQTKACHARHMIAGTKCKCKDCR